MPIAARTRGQTGHLSFEFDETLIDRVTFEQLLL